MADEIERDLTIADSQPSLRSSHLLEWWYGI